MQFQDSKLRPVYLKGVDTSNLLTVNQSDAQDQSFDYSEENFGDHVTEEVEALKQFNAEQKYSKDFD